MLAIYSVFLFLEDKRSQSENTVATLDGSIYQSDKASSVASLVHEIQFQVNLSGVDPGFRFGGAPLGGLECRFHQART